MGGGGGGGEGVKKLLFLVEKKIFSIFCDLMKTSLYLMSCS